jgi:hypothetical protein
MKFKENRMTKEEFKKVKWTGKMKASYNGDLYMVANCDFEEYTVGLVKNEEDTPMEVPCEGVEILADDFFRKGRFSPNFFIEHTRKKIPPLRILKTRAKKRERELVNNMKYRNAPIREYKMEEMEAMGKIVIDTIKQMAHASKRTKSFRQRKFKNKHSKKFKDKMIGKSKHPMVHTLSDGINEEKSKIKDVHKINNA